MDRAQGAIDAARAAGAEQYAGDVYTAATSSLQQSRDAVQQRDYRLALSRALDASERAQEAAKLAADNKAKARGDSETAINQITTAIQQLEARLKAAAVARVPAPAVDRARKAAADAGAGLQNARTALTNGNYLEALATLNATRSQITEGIRQIDEAIDARSPRATKRKR